MRAVTSTGRSSRSLHWADVHLPPAGEQELRLRHRTCGHRTHGKVVCAVCGEELDPRDVDVEA
jgi:hypothetical protein